MSEHLSFGESGPFDADERRVIEEVAEAISHSCHPDAPVLLEHMQEQVRRLDRLGELIEDFPSPLESQSLGRRRRDLTTLVDMLTRTNLSNFDMFLPTRVLLTRNLTMGEVNFYRSLRFMCADALTPERSECLREEVDHRLCLCLYGRMAEELLTHIASDETVTRPLRERAVLALTRIWEQPSYCLTDFFPILQATWEARRRISVTLGTLMGAAEIFKLLQAGCDHRFVDHLIRPEHTEDEEAAFREFLFGATTEQLDRLQHQMLESGKNVVTPDDLDAIRPEAVLGVDPAIALYEFFLSRHLQAGARRLADIPGPKRTAEEYVMLYFLEQLEI